MLCDNNDNVTENSFCAVFLCVADYLKKLTILL